MKRALGLQVGGAVHKDISRWWVSVRPWQICAQERVLRTCSKTKVESRRLTRMGVGPLSVKVSNGPAWETNVWAREGC